jgi:hypothetical protein
MSAKVSNLEELSSILTKKEKRDERRERSGSEHLHFRLKLSNFAVQIYN